MIEDLPRDVSRIGTREQLRLFGDGIRGDRSAGTQQFGVTVDGRHDGEVAAGRGHQNSAVAWKWFRKHASQSPLRGADANGRSSAGGNRNEAVPFLRDHKNSSIGQTPAT